MAICMPVQTLWRGDFCIADGAIQEWGLHFDFHTFFADFAENRTMEWTTHIEADGYEKRRIL